MDDIEATSELVSIQRHNQEWLKSHNEHDPNWRPDERQNEQILINEKLLDIIARQDQRIKDLERSLYGEQGGT